MDILRKLLPAAVLSVGLAGRADAAVLQELKRLGTADETSIPKVEARPLATQVVALRTPDWAGEYALGRARLSVKRLLSPRTLAFSLRNSRETAGILDATGNSVNDYSFEGDGCRVKVGFSVTDKAFVEAGKGCGLGKVNGAYERISGEAPETEFGRYDMNEDGMSGELVLKRLGSGRQHAFEILAVNTVRPTHPTAYMAGLASVSGGELLADAGEGCTFPMKRSPDNSRLELKGVAENAACRVWMGMGAGVDGTYVRR